ncbi:unnamed protein product, partial [Musa hybrid cultivar]
CIWLRIKKVQPVGYWFNCETLESLEGMKKTMLKVLHISDFLSVVRERDLENHLSKGKAVILAVLLCFVVLSNLFSAILLLHVW